MIDVWIDNQGVQHCLVLYMYTKQVCDSVDIRFLLFFNEDIYLISPKLVNKISNYDWHYSISSLAKNARFILTSPNFGKLRIKMRLKQMETLKRTERKEGGGGGRLKKTPKI